MRAKPTRAQVQGWKETAQWVRRMAKPVLWEARDGRAIAPEQLVALLPKVLELAEAVEQLAEEDETGGK